MELSQMLTLKFNNFSNTHSVLLYDEKILSATTTERMMCNQLFDQFIPYSESVFYSIKEENELKEKLIKFFDNLLEKYSLQKEEVIEIYTAADLSNSFILYAKLTNFKCNIVETRPNQIYELERYNWGQKDHWLSPAYANLQKYYSSLCGEDRKSHILIYPETKKNKRYDYEVYDFNTNLSNLSIDISKKILSCFDINVDVLKGNIQLLLTNSISHCVNTSIFTESQVPYIYQLLIDYYGKTGPIVLKQHPHDSWSLMPYIQHSAELNTNFPMEFIRLIPELKINAILSGYTTSAWRIKDLAEVYVEAGLKFFRLCHVLPELGVACDILSNLNCMKVQTNIPLEMIQKFYSKIEFNDKEESDLPKLILSSLLKKTELSKICDDQTVIIDDANLFEKQYYVGFQAITVNVKRTNKTSIAPETSRKIYISDKLELGDYKYHRGLAYSNVIIDSVHSYYENIDSKKLYLSSFCENQTSLEYIINNFESESSLFFTDSEKEWLLKIREKKI